MRISIVGLGKLGAPMAVVMADNGHSVVGVDCDPTRVDKVNAGLAPVQEPELAQMIALNSARLCATGSHEEALAATDVTFLVVPTPSEPHGGFSMRCVLEAAGRLGAALRDKDSFHLFVLSSTVMPGSTGGELLPALEIASGKSCGRHFGLCYNPLFIALGSVIHNLVNPDLVLIGESDERSGDMLAGLHRGICENSPAIRRMNFVNAELTKLSVNTFITTKISYANMLAEVCEQLPGGDVDVVTSAIGCDSRIGRQCLKGAVGYGGPCFPRDNSAFAMLARQLGVPAQLAEATDAVNRRQVARIADLALAALPAGGTVAILGLSYKPDTSVVDESPGLAVAAHLAGEGVRVRLYDPAGIPNARRFLGDSVMYASSAEECARGADVLIVATPWKEFYDLSPAVFDGARRRPTVIDCWRLLPQEKFERVADYLSVGVGPAREPLPARSEVHAGLGA